MLQRVQTVYLLLASIVTGIFPFLLPIGKNSDEISIYTIDSLVATVLFLFSAILSVISISMFKKRQKQLVFCYFNIGLNVILSILFGLYLTNLSGEMQFSEKGIGLALPLIAVVLLLLAAKAIQKDEKIVKSSSRIR